MFNSIHPDSSTLSSDVYSPNNSFNDESEEYTWWSNRGNAWANNVGWRIDYQIFNNHFAYKVRSASIYKDERFSDHAPLIIEYENT